MSKATAVAHSNLAFVKYWGKIDETLNLPLNSSISMTLSNAKTTTTVRFDEDLPHDQVIVAGQAQNAEGRFAQRISQHLDRIRALANVQTPAEVITENTFPVSAGFASSASGLAALSLAGSAALNLNLSERDLTILARRGSGSASRSIPAGFVEWYAAQTSEDSYAEQIAPPEHWDIRDVAVIVSNEEKSVSSSLGHKLAQESPFWESRQPLLPKRLETVRQAIQERDFETFGRELEAEAISMHAIALTSSYSTNGHWHSGIYYWTPDTLELLIAVQQWRQDGIPVYFTLDAGPTVHLICPAEYEAQITAAVQAVQGNRNWSTLVNAPAPGAYLLNE
jgi:diphosphomevalonate decarboxylase